MRVLLVAIVATLLFGVASVSIAEEYTPQYVELLKKQLRDKVAEVNKLKEESAQLKTDNAALKAENEQLKKKIPAPAKANAESAAPPAQDVRSLLLAGFRGLRWGMSIDGAPNMVLCENAGDRQFYKRTDDPSKIGEARLAEVVYGFYKGRLSCVIIHAQGLGNWTALRDAVFATYGKGARSNDHEQYYTWESDPDKHDEGVLLSLQFNNASEKSTLYMSFKVIKAEEKRDKAKKAAEAKNDF